MARTACVFTDPKRSTYAHVTAGDTLFEAVSRAMNWFDETSGNTSAFCHPIKKGSLVAEILITATLPVEPMAQWAFFIG